MTDLISRRAAMDAVEESMRHNPHIDAEIARNHECEHRHFLSLLRSLPPSEHEARKPNYSGDGYADGCMVYDLAECPECGYEYEDGDRDWGEPYCPHCGQLLDWGGSKYEYTTEEYMYGQDMGNPEDGSL